MLVWNGKSESPTRKVFIGVSLFVHFFFNIPSAGRAIQNRLIEEGEIIFRKRA